MNGHEDPNQKSQSTNPSSDPSLNQKLPPESSDKTNQNQSQSSSQSKSTRRNSRIVCTTFGDQWAQLFEDSFARQLAGIVHLKAGDPTFQVTEFQMKAMGLNQDDWASVIERLNRKTVQASELVWKLSTLVNFSDVIFIDTKMLDTAIGQLVLNEAKEQSRHVWAVGVDSKTSPIAPAFIKGILYPSSPDELVRLAIG